jgi:bla regulator protein BlaR1
MILLTKKLLKKHISIKFQYYIWYTFLFLLPLPFVSVNFYSFNPFNWINNIGRNHITTTHLSEITSGSNAIMTGNGWLHDFAVSGNHYNKELFTDLILIIWLAGIITMIILTYVNNYKILRIIKYSKAEKNQQILAVFEQCKEQVGIHKDIPLLTSSVLQSPITFGIFHTKVILPEQTLTSLSVNDLCNIFLHELQHHRQKHFIVNYIMCLFQIIYWFNPLVWYALLEMRTDLEVACDISVLELLDENSYWKYGNTIINFADKVSCTTNFSCVSEMGGSNKQIKKRIIKIASYCAESKWTKIKSVFILLLISIIILSGSPFLSIRAADYSNTTIDENNLDNNTKYEDLNSYFDGYQGCFVLYNTEADQYTIYNKDRCMMRYSPDSTYKIYSALSALEYGVITGENSQVEWDGKKYPYDAWNKNQNLNSAMEYSVNWYFQSLDKWVGLTNLKKYFTTIKYGNSDLSSGIADYWMESSLLISPLEQIELLKNFYTNKFHFKEKNIQAVKDSLLLYESNGAFLSGKTGTGLANKTQGNGWFIGYVEIGSNTYFFATNIQTSIQNGKNANGSSAVNITLSILKDKGIFLPK